SSSAALNSSTGSGSRVSSSAMTSSFTQFVSSASRASRAVSTASRAVQHPAVFGSTRMPRRSSMANTESRDSESKRRIATVVSSVPEVRRAVSRMLSELAPPVPMTSRASRSAPSIVQVISASLHGGDDVAGVTVGQGEFGPVAPADDFAVDGDGDAQTAAVGRGAVLAQLTSCDLGDEVERRGGPAELMGLSVEDDGGCMCGFGHGVLLIMVVVESGGRQNRKVGGSLEALRRDGVERARGQPVGAAADREFGTHTSAERGQQDAVPEIAGADDAAVIDPTNQGQIIGRAGAGPGGDLG